MINDEVNFAFKVSFSYFLDMKVLPSVEKQGRPTLITKNNE
jgi:hypothetical protein